MARYGCLDRFWLAVMGSSVLFLGAQAGAAEPSFACRTITSRSSGELIVNLASSEEKEPRPDGDEEVFARPKQEAIALLPGETLCVTGAPDAEGGLRDLRILTDAEERKDVVMLRLDSGAETQLVLRHSFGRALMYEMAAVYDVADVAFPARGAEVSPGKASYVFWRAPVRRLLLFGIRLTSPSVSEESQPESPAPVEQPPPATGSPPVGRPAEFRLRYALSLTAGVHRVRPSGLDAALSEHGFSTLPTKRTLWGAELDLWLGRLRLAASAEGTEMTSRNVETGAEVRTSHGLLGFIVGYQLYRRRSFAVFANSGIVFGAMTTDSRVDGFTTFANRLRPREGNRVETLTTLFPLELGAEYALPFYRTSPRAAWVLVLGARAGWLQQIGGNEWNVVAHEDEGGRSLGGDPRVNLSGSVFRLVLGVGRSIKFP